MNTFYHLLVNTMLSSVTNLTVWFALIFFIFLETKSVFATSVLSGIYLLAVALTGIWFGSLVDHHKKKTMMLLSNIASLIIYTICFIIYITAPQNTFNNPNSVTLWIFTVLILMGVIAGNIRGIALPTIITLIVEENKRDKANGLSGTANGIAFLITSVISGILVGQSGMFLVLIVSSTIMILTIIHLLFISVPENLYDHQSENKEKKVDVKGTIKAIRVVPGLMALIFFATFNNFLGGVYMSLMDAYGLSLVSVQVWGFIWGILSSAFIIGGLIIAKFGLGKNPLKALFLTNITIWTISIFMAVQPSIILLAICMFIYLAVVPFIEASEQTIFQKVVPPERQGRVFGFAQSIEQAASPLTAFAIGPLTQFFFIPFMTDGWGAITIGSWFGTGLGRGIALVFIATGIIGLIITLLAMRSKFYKALSKTYLEK